MVDDACLLKLLVSWPGAKGPFRHVYFHIDKSGFLDTVLAGVIEIEWPPRLMTSIDQGLSPMSENVVRGETTIIRDEVRSQFELLDPSARADIPVR